MQENDKDEWSQYAVKKPTQDDWEQYAVKKKPSSELKSSATQLLSQGANVLGGGILGDISKSVPKTEQKEKPRSKYDQPKVNPNRFLDIGEPVVDPNFGKNKAGLMVGQVPDSKPAFAPELAIRKGELQGRLANVLSTGKRPTNDELGQIAMIQSELQSIPQSEADAAFQKDGWEIFKKNPLLGTEFLGETVLSSLTSLFEAGKRTVPAAIGIGAAAGAPIAGIGAIGGAISGLTAGVTTGGFNLSTSGKIIQTLSDEGVDVADKDSLIAAFSDEVKMSKIRKRALKYGIPIAVLDAISGGFAGKLVAGAAGKSLAKRTLAGFGEVGMQSVAGMTGEAGGQYLADGKLNRDEILLEGIAGLVTDVPEIVSGVAMEKLKDRSSSKKTLATQVAVLGNEMGADDAKYNLNRDLANKVITPEEHEQGVAFVEKAVEINNKIPEIVIGENRATSIELIEERERLTEEVNQREEQKKGIDVAYHKVLDESNKEVQKRIDEINNQLGELAKPEKNVEEALVEDWSKDVESIEKNLKDKIVISPDGRSNNLWGIEELVPYEEKQEIMRLFIDGDYSKSVPISRIIAEAYNKAKSDNSNPKLVKAVEDLLGTPKNKVAEEEIQQPIEDAVEINVLSMLKESKILSKTEKAILYRQYKNGVMNENDISKYTNVEINDLKNDNITKWAKVILDKTKAKKIDAEDIDFEEILNEPIQQIPDENIQPPIEEQGEVVEAVRVEQEPEAKPQKVFAEKDLDRAKAKKVHQRVREMEAPSDAAQIALRYIADGGKVSEAAINEVAGTVKRARLNTGAKELKSNEAKSRDYYQKDGETLDELAHRLWENSSQEVSEIDIKDALMSVIGDYNTRLEAGTAYLEQYNAEYIQEKYYERLAEEREEEWKKEQDELERQLRTDVDEQIEGEASEEHINNLIKQYESEFKAENQQPKPASKADANKEIGGRASGKEDGNEKGKVGEQPIGEAKPKQEDVEKELIIKKAKENDSLYKAPNGKKSNLSNDLWVLVRTKKFKEKFGDWEAEESNVLKDENGEPMKVYHGTAYDPTKGMFTEFDRSKNKFGYTFFSSNRDAAIEWSKDRMTYTKTEPYIVEAFISLDNPAIKDYKGGFISDEDISLFQKSKEKSYIIKNVIDTAEGREIVNDVYAVDNENVFSINLSNLSGEVKENLKEGQKIAEENKGSELSWVKESKKIGGVDALFIKSNDEMGVAGGSMGSVSKKYVLGKRNFYNYDGYEIQEIVPRKDLNQDQSVKYFVKSKVDPNELYEFKNDVDWGKVKQQEKVLKEKMLSDINNADLSKLDKIISNKDKENIDKIIKSKVAKGKSESISFLETIRDFYKEKIPYPYSIEVLAKIVIEKGGNVESLNNIKDIIYETKNKEESEIILNKKQVKKEQPKTLLEEEYEEVTKKKGEKAQQKAKEKLIEDNFKGIVAQLMTANKIKRRGDCD